MLTTRLRYKFYVICLCSVISAIGWPKDSSAETFTIDFTTLPDKTNISAIPKPDGIIFGGRVEHSSVIVGYPVPPGYYAWSAYMGYGHLGGSFDFTKARVSKITAEVIGVHSVGSFSRNPALNYWATGTSYNPTAQDICFLDTTKFYTECTLVIDGINSSGIFNFQGVGGQVWWVVLIKKLTIDYEPVVFLDLWPHNLQVSQTGASLGSDGILKVVPGIPVKGSVSIISAANSLNQNETRSSILTVQAGNHTYSQSFNLSETRSQQGMLTISFSITFDPSDAGIQTITATVNPGHEPPETDYSYNAKSVQVKVVGDFKLMLNLSVPEVYPNNTSGNSNTIITALLSDSAGNPVYGKSIQFYSAPQDGSGGHIAEIHHGARPKGTFESSSCTTGADGTCQVTYTASQFGGLEKILGNLSGNASVKDSKTLTVKVPALAPLSGGPYTFKCFGNSSEPSCPGGGYGHTSFYSVQSFVDEDMFAIASAYSGTFPGAPLLTVTDASLSWGGLYDYKNTWTNPHRFHREGTDIDIRSTSIPDDNQETFESIVCRLGGFPNLELAGLPNEHYHLYFHTYSSAISSYCQDSQ